jgi:hypothetical protein
MGSWRLIASHGSSGSHAQQPRPDLAALAALAAPDEHRAAGSVQIALLKGEGLADP